MEGLKLRWLGAAGFEFLLGDAPLVIDPYLTRIPFLRQWVGRVQADPQYIAAILPECGSILVSHPHFDHLMDVPALINATGAAAYGSENTCRLLTIHGIGKDRIRLIHEGETFQAGNARVTVLLARHGKVPGFGYAPLKDGLSLPLKARDYKMDKCFSFYIETGGISILTVPGLMEEDPPKADILLINTLYTAADYRRILDCVQPKLVIPSHWDDMCRPLSKKLKPFVTLPSFAIPPVRKVDLGRFAETIRSVRANTKVFVPEVLQYYDIAELSDGTSKQGPFL